MKYKALLSKKISQNLLFAAEMIGSLWINSLPASDNFYCLLKTFKNSSYKITGPI